MNEYHLTLTKVQQAGKPDVKYEPIHLDIEVHDEIYEIIERVKEKNVFSNEKVAAQFAIGLKLFAEVMIENRKHPLFDEFFPSFKSFMKNLKQYRKDS